MPPTGPGGLIAFASGSETLDQTKPNASNEVSHLIVFASILCVALYRLSFRTVVDRSLPNTFDPRKKFKGIEGSSFNFLAGMSYAQPELVSY
jgi:hypothetical protein